MRLSLHRSAASNARCSHYALGFAIAALLVALAAQTAAADDWSPNRQRSRSQRRVARRTESSEGYLFPVQYVDSPASALSQSYKDEYAVMIANGYLADGDLQGAIQRIRVLGIDNVPIYVQGTAERYISNSGDVNDIRPLVALAKALGRLTPPMEPYQQVSVPGQGG